MTATTQKQENKTTPKNNMKRLFNLALDALYFLVLGFKYFYIYTHNSFTWLYNQLSRLLGSKRRFYYVHEKPTEPLLSQKILGWFRWNKKSQTDYRKKYEQAQAQSDRNFQRYKDRKAQSDKNYALYQSCQKKSQALEAENMNHKKTIQDLKNQLAQAKQSNTNHQTSSKPNDTRSNEAIFGLASGFSQQELKESYQRLTSRYHPDKHTHMSPAFVQEATEEFKKIQSAYKKLKTSN